MHPEHRMIDIGDDLQISVRVTGDLSGPVILFANGSIFNFKLFDLYFIPTLQKMTQLENLSLVNYDYIGIGNSSDLPGEYDFEELAEHQKTVVDALKIENIHLFGYSKGGLINLIFAAKYPDLVKTVACYGPINIGDNVANDGYDSEYSLRLQNTKSLEGIWKDSINERNLSLVYDTVYVPSIFKKQVFELSVMEKMRNSQIKKMLKPLLLGTKIESIYKLYNYYSQKVDDTSKERFINGMKTISAPTLIMHGNEDTITSTESALLLREWIPNCEYTEFKGYDHSEPLLTKQSKKLVTAYLQFLEGKV